MPLKIVVPDNLMIVLVAVLPFQIVRHVAIICVPGTATHKIITGCIDQKGSRVIVRKIVSCLIFIQIILKSYSYYPFSVPRILTLHQKVLHQLYSGANYGIYG